VNNTLFSPICATRSAHLDLLHLITHTISGERRRSRSSSYCCVRHSQSQPLSRPSSQRPVLEQPPSTSFQVVTLAVTELLTSYAALRSGCTYG
jgi:hypothetical protein